MSLYVVVSLLATLPFLALNAYLLHYMDRLEAEGCKCALGWHRRVIEASLIFFIVLSLLQIGILLLGGGAVPLGLVVPLVLLAPAVGLTFIVVTRLFLNEVARTHCDCARGTAYKVLDVLNIISIVLLVLSVLSKLGAAIAGSRGAAEVAAAAPAVRASGRRLRRG